MAATKYQVMYRFMNDTLGTPVTNNANTTYDPTFEFYTDPDHRIFSSDAIAQNEEMNKQQDMITFANSSANEKHDMLFVFDGTKKISHKVWKDDQIGYVVRDWTQIPRSKIGNRDDYTKDFITLDAYSPEDGGQVVCTAEVFKQYFSKKLIVTESGDYSSDELQELFTNTTYFQVKIPTWKDHAVKFQSPIVYWSTPYSSYYGYHRNGVEVAKDYRNAPVKVDESRETNKITGYKERTTSQSVAVPLYTNGDNCYSGVYIQPSDIDTTTIPGHYEDSADAPYAVKDQYQRIESSPWIVNCTVGSFEAALEKARILVDMIGIENVKIIKVVPFNQFVKVK